MRAGYAGLDQPVIEEYVRHFSQPGALTAALNHFRAFNFGDWLALPPATVPALFAWGADDPYLARSTALATRSHVTARYTEAELAGVGHWVPELASEAVTALLLEHMSA
jgi:pimeloyl-ACP methyl ester carboxylesterase